MSPDTTTPRDLPLLVALDELGLIRIAGADATSFLHNLCTNDVAGIPPDGVRLGALCTAKGRMLASFVYWRDGDGYLLQVSAELLPELVKKLSMFVLRSQVRVSDASAEFASYGVSGPGAERVLAMLTGVTLPPTAMTWVALAEGNLLALGDQRYQLILPKAAAETTLQRLGAVTGKGDLNDWRLSEIRAGIPRITQATKETFVPQMVNYELIGGVNFKKGCYPGQEIVARTQYLGKIKRRMYRALIEAPNESPAAGQSLFAPETAGQSCGNLVLVANASDGVEVLAVIQSSCAEAGEVHLGSPDGPSLTLQPLPYNLD